MQLVLCGTAFCTAAEGSSVTQILPLNVHVSDVSICLKKVNCRQLYAELVTSQEKSVVLGNFGLIIELNRYARAIFLRRQHRFFFLLKTAEV